MIPQQTDSLRAVLDSVFAAPAYSWVRRPEPLAQLRHAWLAFQAWLDGMQERQPLLYHLVIYLLVAAMLALVLHAAWTFVQGVRRVDEVTDHAGPHAVRHDEAWYRTEADRLAAAGRFAEAVQAEFLALVLALDARQAVRFHPSKTPGEYVRESQFPPVAREEFRELVRRLYAYAFARSPCGPAEFSDWRALAVPERYAPAN